MQAAVSAALAAQPAWAAMPSVQRGDVLNNVVTGLKARAEDMARVVALETGKSFKDALGETKGAILQGQFMAGEGHATLWPHHDFGRHEQAGDDGASSARRRRSDHRGQHAGRQCRLEGVSGDDLRQCRGAEGFRGCAGDGLAVRRDRPRCRTAGGVLNIVQGLGAEAGRPLVAASARRGVQLYRLYRGRTRDPARVGGERLAKISLELGGKNPLVVCDDADLDAAVEWTVLSAFSNAGQRCASGSRIIIFDSRLRFLPRPNCWSAPASCKIGPSDDDDFGPVINERQLTEHADRARQGASRRRVRSSQAVQRLTAAAHAQRSLYRPHDCGECRPRGRNLGQGIVRSGRLSLPREGFRCNGRAGQ